MSYTEGMRTNDHQRLDRRSLALHRAVAAALCLDPGLVQKARDNLARWEQTTPGPWIAEWREVLDGPLDALLALLVSPDENATRMRQSSPFTGVLSATERKMIYESHAA